MSILQELEAERDIRRMLAEYAQFADDGDGGGLASLFTSDGAITLAGQRYVGPDAIARWLESTSTGGPTKHLIANQNIQIETCSRAAGVMDLVFLAKDETGWRVLGTARYADRFVKADDRWRFAERSITAD